MSQDPGARMPPWESLLEGKPGVTLEFAEFVRQGYSPATQGSYSWHDGDEWVWQAPREPIMTDQHPLPIEPHHNLYALDPLAPTFTDGDAMHYARAWISSGQVCRQYSRVGMNVRFMLGKSANKRYHLSCPDDMLMCIVHAIGIFDASTPRGRVPCNAIYMTLDGKTGENIGIYLRIE